MTIDFLTVAGVDGVSPATPSISRVANAPSIESFTAILVGFQVVTYADFLNPMAIDDTGGSGRLWVLEGLVGGVIRNFQSGGTSTNYWADARVTWNSIATAGRAANIIGYHQSAAGVFSTTGTIASPAGANNLLANGTEFYSASQLAGRYRWKAMKVYSVELTASQVQREFWSILPRRWANLTFFNPGFFAASCNTDFSNTGGNMTLNGLGTDDASDPSKPWCPLRTYGYGY